VSLYEARTGREVDQLSVSIGDVFGMSFSRDGGRLAVSDGQTVECYDVKTKTLIRRLDLGEAQRTFMRFNVQPRVQIQYSRVALSPDGKRVAAATKPGTDQLSLWNLSDAGAPLTVGRGGDRRLASVVVFTLTFAAWAAAWGIVRKRNRDGRSLTNESRTRSASASPIWRRVCAVCGCLILGGIWLAELTSRDSFRWRDLNFWLIVQLNYAYIAVLQVAGLIALVCFLFILLLVRRIWALRVTRQSPVVCVSAGNDQLPAPWSLSACWVLMGGGGLFVLATGIGTFFLNEMIPANYLSLVIGVMAISRAASRDTRGLVEIAGLQALGILNCDCLNVFFAAIEVWLLRRASVRDYLRRANAAAATS
jgi:hypothetical protein